MFQNIFNNKPCSIAVGMVSGVVYYSMVRYIFTNIYEEDVEIITDIFGVILNTFVGSMIFYMFYIQQRIEILQAYDKQVETE